MSRSVERRIAEQNEGENRSNDLNRHSAHRIAQSLSLRLSTQNTLEDMIYTELQVVQMRGRLLAERKLDTKKIGENVSDTPLTDARWSESLTANTMSDYAGIAYGHNWPQIAEEAKHHAEQLERQLAAMTAERDEAVRQRDELGKALDDIMVYVLEDYYQQCATLEFEAAVKNARAILSATGGK